MSARVSDPDSVVRVSQRCALAPPRQATVVDAYGVVEVVDVAGVVKVCFSVRGENPT